MRSRRGGFLLKAASGRVGRRERWGAPCDGPVPRARLETRDSAWNWKLREKQTEAAVPRRRIAGHPLARRGSGIASLPV